ncbi:hypothetical protein ABZ897_27130 [Nonomuraea sp. NPDC046802]|uniref:WD40 repeat domain-containing protein n=1 Tax=Nonomuraea sp. NPDC046802 TaxID=3154919 RepID=UPI0033DCB812
MDKVEELVDRVKSGGRWRRRRAVRRLARARTPDAVRALAVIAVSPEVSFIDHKVISIARAAFTDLGEQRLVDTACEALLASGHPWLAKLVKSAGYRHSDSSRDAVVSFLTGDVERFRALDPAGRALRDVRERGDEMLRFRLAERARAETLMEWVRAVVGEGAGFDGVTDREWSGVAEILGATGRWKILWRLVFAAPPAWGARMLRMLDDADWRPADAIERRAYTELTALTRASRAVLGHEWVPADPTRLSDGVSGVWKLVVTPDGTRVCVSTGHEVRVWRLPSGTLQGTIRCDSFAAHLAVTPDSTLLAMNDTVYRPWPHNPRADAQMAKLWELSTLKPAGVLTGNPEEPNAMLITADGRFLVMGDRIGRIHLWHLPSGRSAGTLVGTGNAVSGLANSTGGKLLASSHVGGTILLWELQDRALKGRLRYGGSLIRQVLMPDGGTVVAVAPVIKVWDFIERGRRPRVVGYVSGDVAMTPDGTLLAAGTLHGMHTWRLPSGAQDRVFPFQGSKPSKWCTLGEGKLLAGFGTVPGVQLWRLPGGSVEGTLAGEGERSIDHVTASADGNTIVTADADDVVTLWRLWDERLRVLSRLPLADIDPAAIQAATRPAGEPLPGERTWRELLTALVRWRDHERIAAHDHPWDPTDGTG